MEGLHARSDAMRTPGDRKGAGAFYLSRSKQR